MISDFKPIVFDCPTDQPTVEIYFAHDIHYGNEQADIKRWERFKQDILSEPNRYVIFVGDYCETAIIGSKSDTYTQKENIAQQQLWLTQQLHDLRERTVAIVQGNHEARITKQVGLYPVFEAACKAGVEDKYRTHFAFVDIGVGVPLTRGHPKRYFGFVTHRLRDCKSYNGSDFVDGIDFACYGHDHDAKDHARSKLVYDSKIKQVYQRDIEVVNSGSFVNKFGGYAVDAGYRPANSKLYKLVLESVRSGKSMRTVGFHI